MKKSMEVAEMTKPMERILVRPVWAWECPDCQTVNLMTSTPQVGMEVFCGEPALDGESGCGLGYSVGQLSETVTVAEDRVFKAEVHSFGLPQ